MAQQRLSMVDGMLPGVRGKEAVIPVCRRLLRAANRACTLPTGVC